MSKADFITKCTCCGNKQRDGKQLTVKNFYHKCT